MDFQGQGKALTGESEALVIIDASARYVVVIPLHDRHATSFIPKFLDQVIFRQGPPEVLHSDAAQEFLSEALELFATTAQIETTTTLGHNANCRKLVGGGFLEALESLHAHPPRRPIPTMARAVVPNLLRM